MDGQIKDYKNKVLIMRVRISIFLLFFLLNNLYCQNKKEETNDLKMEIVFQDFFKNDTVTVKVNNITIADKVIINSDRLLGVTNLQYDFTDKGIFNRYDKENGFKINNLKIKLNSIVNIDIVLNDIKYHFKVNLQKGKHLGFNNYEKLSLNQLNRHFMYD